MKSKIKIVTDSACDIPREEELQYGIEILSFPVAVDDRDYMERIDFTNEEFYKLLSACSTVPATAQITQLRFMELYQQAYQEGYTDLIYISINSSASATYANSIMARECFYEEHPHAKEGFRIHLVDSKTYTIAYGYPVIQAAIKADRGVEATDIVAYLEDWFDSVEIYFAPYSLEFVKKSGRISCAAAFVGEMVGLRPIISIIDGQTKIVEKVRGDRSIIPTLLKHAQKQMVPKTDYCLVGGALPERFEELKAEAHALLRYEPVKSVSIGAAIAINAGPKVVGIIVKGQKRD